MYLPNTLLIHFLKGFSHLNKFQLMAKGIEVLQRVQSIFCFGVRDYVEFSEVFQSNHSGPNNLFSYIRNNKTILKIRQNGVLLIFPFTQHPDLRFGLR